MTTGQTTDTPPAHESAFAAHVRNCAFAKLLAAHGDSPTALLSAMEPHLIPGMELPHPQRVTSWRNRGWASPMHFLPMLPLLDAAGVTLVDLYRDRFDAERAKAADAKGEGPG